MEGGGEGNEYVKLLYVPVPLEEGGRERGHKVTLHTRTPPPPPRTRFPHYHFRAQNEVSISGPTPSIGPQNSDCPHPNHYVPRHINNRYIHSYYY
jgi:hypothetical protein